MIVAIHQPNFLPWLGYFYKIVRSDVFVILDNVQYTKNSYINRNKIKTPNGEAWLTVPVITEGRFGQLIKDTKINNAVDWRKKHMGSLRVNYGRAPSFDFLFKDLESIYYEKEWQSLCGFNIRLIRWAAAQLGSKTHLVLASELGVEGKGTELLINILKKVGGSAYLSGFGGSKYQDETAFEQHGIKLMYSDFRHPIYPQLWGDFVPNLSIVDLMFNCGPESLGVILGDLRP
jgi:hypothetical protein